MATAEEVNGWLGSGIEVACILDRPYRTLRSQALKLKLPGRRGHKRYSIVEVFKFRLADLMWSRGFSTRNVRAMLDEGISVVLRQLKEAPGEDWIFVLSQEGDEVNITRIRWDQLPEVNELLANSTRAFVLLNMSAIAQEVMARLAAHIDDVPYVSRFDQFKKSFLKVAKERRERMVAVEREQ
jgi:hypothetical protein